MLRSHPQQPPTKRGQAQLPGTPTLAELERFSDAGLRQWRQGWERYREIYSTLYFELERQRAQHADEIADALLRNAAPPEQIRGWARMVDYQFGLAPLSVAGSLSDDGGRFNIGKRLNSAAFAPFGALYVADSHDASFAEKFTMRPGDSREGLSASELALRRPNSYVFVAIDGFLEHFFNIGNRGALEDFVRVIARFKMPERVIQLARAIRIVPPAMIRSVSALKTQVLHPNWRTLPVHFSLPSNSQIFGRLLHAAGFHGVSFPSSKCPGSRCIALFPDNWRGSATEIHVTGPVPEGARLTQLDGTTPVFE
jgi:hypothetical protein